MGDLFPDIFFFKKLDHAERMAKTNTARTAHLNRIRWVWINTY